MKEFITAHPNLIEFLKFASILTVTNLFLYLITTLIIPFFQKLALKTATRIDDLIFERKIPHKISRIISAVLLYFLSSWLNFFWLKLLVERFALSWLIFSVASLLITLTAEISVLRKKKSRKTIRSLTGLVQAIQMIIGIIAVILTLSVILGKSPFVFLSSIGALAAILTLAFRETILSIMSGILIQTNDLYREGDWLEIPQYGIDGDLIELGLHVIRVRNWDKTVSTLPIVKLMNAPVKNWRGMKETGGRRIKRSVLIDQTSIRFLTNEELTKLAKIEIIADYIRNVQSEIAEHNKNKDLSVFPNGRRLTNIGVFRNYLKCYLKNHEAIRQDLTLLVRQLHPEAESGLPVQIYCFTKTTVWGEYEDIQSDIFDHLLSIMPEFSLKPFQRSSSYLSKGDSSVNLTSC